MPVGRVWANQDWANQAWEHIFRAGEIINQSGFTGIEAAAVDAGQPYEYLIILPWLLLVPLSINLIDRIFDTASATIEEWRYTHFQALSIYRLEVRVPNQVADMVLLPVRFLQGAAIVLLLALNLLLVFSLFPQTHQVVQSLLGGLIDILVAIARPFIDAIPNLLALLVIAIFTYYTLKVIRFLSEGFKKGRVKLSGIHPDLVEPTFQIVRFLVICLALVAAYPYIPGSDSPAFRYISIFVGFLLSLGSTSLVSNIVAGIVLTYMRGMKVGDRVQIADTVGDVVDRTLLVTRVRTIKNVIITIPNGLVLNSHIINFSTSAQEKGLILNTCVTIGYDVPWRQVHDLLVESARATEHILEKPAPFVFQTSLNDYYVTYELNAYTRHPEDMAATYSALHENIQDYFNAAGVEILSPAYSAFRDGSPSTIPVGQGAAAIQPSAYQPGGVFHPFLQGIPFGTRKPTE